MSNNESDWPQTVTDDGAYVVVKITRADLTTVVGLRNGTELLTLPALDNLIGILQAARHELRKVEQVRRERRSATELFVTTMGGAEAAEAALEEWVAGAGS